MTLTCPECGCATVPGLTCPCPPVRTPAALAALLAKRDAEDEAARIRHEEDLDEKCSMDERNDIVRDMYDGLDRFFGRGQ